MDRAQPKAWKIWWAVVVMFILLSLWPIWSMRFPPLQDYPQHLLQAKMLAARNDPQFDYGRYFEFHLRPVYATFFAITVPLAKFLPIEVAGKTALTFYIALVAALVIKLAHRWGDACVPWGLVLLFPLAFNQQYFAGNINFCYSLPILVFALLDQEDLVGRPLSVRGAFRQLLWQALLLITHPLAFLLYLGLTTLGIAYLWRKRAQFVRSAGIILSAGVALYVVLIVVWKSDGLGSAVVSQGSSALWKPVSETLGFYCYMFTGMRWHEGVDAGSVVVWLISFGCIFGCLVATRQRRARLEGSHLMFFVAVTAGVFLLPFAVGYYTFINFRLAAVSYFFFVLLMGRIKFHGWWAVMLVACAGMTLLLSVVKQRRVSKEIESIVPVIQIIPPNAQILPIVFARNSPELDPVYFDPHLHAHDYYHILRGGGLNPYFLAAPIHPVHLKHGVTLPAPGEYNPHLFRWEEHADDYQYFLVRDAPTAFIFYISAKADLVAQHDAWLLFKNR